VACPFALGVSAAPASPPLDGVVVDAEFDEEPFSPAMVAPGALVVCPVGLGVPSALAAELPPAGVIVTDDAFAEASPGAAAVASGTLLD